MLMIAPCKDCSDRFVGCHSVCPRYAEFREECEARRKKRAERYPIKDYTCELIARNQKAAHRRRK